MNPQDYASPDDYAKAFSASHPGYFPTYFSSFQCSWKILRETEKAVMTHDSDDRGAWFPRSKVVISEGCIIGIERKWYSRIRTTSQRGF